MGASRASKGLMKRRRRIADDEGEEEGSVAAVVEDDSLSDASAISDADDDADGEGSDGSESLSAANKRSDVGVVTNGHRKEPRQPPQQVPATSKNGLLTGTSRDTETMMNGLKIEADAEGNSVNFEDMAHVSADPESHQPKAADGQVSVTGTDKGRRDHEEYKKRRDEDPAFVPNRGVFFMHDHRSSAPGQNGFRPFGRGRGRGRGNGIFPHFGYVQLLTPRKYNSVTNASGRQTQSGPTDAPWAHDLHESIAQSDNLQPDQNQAPISQDRQRPPIAVTKTPLPNRSFSGSRHVGNAQIRILMHGMTEPIIFSAVPVHQHTRLPHHRPPLRRDKPVRISLPDTPIRYIFPATERSFIFIPRALRPNQQGFGRMRGRGSFGGGYGSFGALSSRRTSVYNGSGYSPSIAMSRRSSLAREVMADGVSSPGTGSFPRQPGVVMEAGKPVVRLPPSADQPFVPQAVAPTVNLPPSSTYAFPHNAAVPEGRSENLPMHHPKPERTVQVGDIDTPTTLEFNAPQPQQQQPFHQQVPQLSTYQPDLSSQFQHARNSSHPSQVGTPLQNIPDTAIHAQPFQPYPYSQQPGFYPQPYPPPVYFYPPVAQPGGPSSATAPSFVPGQQFYYPMPMAPAAQPQAPVPGAPIQTVAHESGGMVYYYNPAELAHNADAGAQFPQQGYAPPIGMGDMVPFYPPSNVYYPPPPQQ